MPAIPSYKTPPTTRSRPSPPTENTAGSVESESMCIKSISPVGTANTRASIIPIDVAMMISPDFIAMYIVIATGISMIRVIGL